MVEITTILKMGAYTNSNIGQEISAQFSHVNSLFRPMCKKLWTS